MLRAVLWDLDGTLVDSAVYHWRAWRAVLGPRGIDVSWEQFAKTFGQRNDRILREWLGEQATEEEIQAVGDAKEAYYRELIRKEGIEPLAGASEWVCRLAERGWKQAIASSAPRANVEVVLDGLNLRKHFQAIVSAEDVRRGKPDPEVFLLAAARLGVPPNRCIVVEDAPAGLEAARRAGMKAIGVGRADNHLQADLLVESLDQLPEDAFERLLEPAQMGS